MPETKQEETPVLLERNSEYPRIPRLWQKAGWQGFKMLLRQHHGYFPWDPDNVHSNQLRDLFCDDGVT